MKLIYLGRYVSFANKRGSPRKIYGHARRNLSNHQPLGEWPRLTVFVGPEEIEDSARGLGELGKDLLRGFSPARVQRTGRPGGVN